MRMSQGLETTSYNEDLMTQSIYLTEKSEEVL